MITKENFDNNICEDYYCPNSIFYSKNKRKDLINVSVNEGNKINIKSIDLESSLSKSKHIIADIANILNNNIKCKDIIFIDENVVSFFTASSKGTGHGFSDIFDCLINYFNNYDKYSNLKVIVYKYASQGILDIVYHLINKDKILHLEHKQIYKFKSITFLNNQKPRNPLHMLRNDDFFDKFQKFLIKNYINKVKYLPPNNILNNVLLVKDKDLINVSTWRDRSDGFDSNDINNFCKKFNYTRILPEELNEVELINILNNCKKLAISFGTAHWKNIPYTSDKCIKINVFVKRQNPYLDQYLSFTNGYNNYISSGKTNERTKALKIYDPPRAKYHIVENLSEVEIL